MTIRLPSRSFGSSFVDQEVIVSVTTTQPYHGSYPIPRLERATVLDASTRDVAAFVGGDDHEGTAFDAALLPGRLERTVTPADIESQGGLPVDHVAQLDGGIRLGPAGGRRSSLHSPGGASARGAAESG
jgi:hypothetical protein